MKKAWSTKRLGDLFVFKNGRAFKKEEWTTKGLPIIRIQNLNSEVAPFNYFAGEYGQDILVEPGDLLFSWSGTVGSSFGSHLWNGERGVLNQHIFKIGIRETIEKRYAFHGLRYITEEIEQSVSGAVGLVHITKEKLNEFTLPVPPLPEQRRIVGILDEAFEGLATATANAEQNLRNARALFESQLQSVFTQRGQGWVEKRIGDVFDVGSSKRVLEKDWTPSGVPFYGGREVVQLAQSGAVVSDAYISEERYRDIAAVYGVPQEGDILMTARGTIGVGYVVKKSDKFYYKDGNLICLHPKTPTEPYFVLYAFRSKLIKDQLATLTGATVTHLPLEKTISLLLPFPAFSIQKRVVGDLRKLESEAQRLESIYQQKLAALGELKKSLLHQAFTGEL